MSTAELQELVAATLLLSWALLLMCLAGSVACVWILRYHSLAAENLPAGSPSRATARGKVEVWHMWSIPFRLGTIFFILTTACGHFLYDAL